MANGDQQLQFEIALRDSASTVLKTVGRELDAINRKLIEVGASGSGLDDIRKRFQSLDEQGKKTRSSIGGLNSVFGGLSKTVLGPLGVVAGFVAIAKSLDNFAVANLQLSNFARNVGLSVSEVNRFSQQAARAGVDPAQASGALASMASVLKEMFTNQTMSSNWKRLQEMNAPLAQNVLHLMEQGKTMEAIQQIQESYFRAPEMGRYRNELERMFGQTRTLFETSRDQLEGVPKLWVPATEAAKAYHEKITDIETALTNIKNMTMAGFILGDVMGKPGEPTMSISGPRGWGPDVTAKPQGKFFTGQVDRPVAPGGAFEMFGSEMPAQPESIPSKFKRWFQSGKNLLKMSEADAAELPAGARPTLFAQENLKIEEDTNQSLHDIRDILTRMEDTIEFSAKASPAGTTTTGFGRIPPMGQLPGRDGTGGPKPGGTTQDIPIGPGQYGQTSLAPNTLGQVGRGLGALPSAARGGHQGGDYMVPHGTPLSAPDDITVTRAGWFGDSAGFGIEWRDSNGAMVKVFHLREDPKKLGIEINKKYNRGDIIGYAGTTGNAAGGAPHFHVEVRRDGKITSPHEYFWGGAKVGTKFAPSGEERPATFAERFRGEVKGGDLSQAGLLAQHRASLIKELQRDPQKMDRMMGLAQAEVGNDPEAQQAFVETTLDRWAHRKQTIEQGMASEYFGQNPRYRTPTPQTQKQFPGIISRAAAGSATFPGATGNASGRTLAAHIRRGEGAGMAGGEGFVFEQPDIEFKRRILAAGDNGEAPATFADRFGAIAGAVRSTSLEREALRAENEAKSRAIINNNLAKTDSSKNGTVRADIDFSNMAAVNNKKVSVDDPGVFKILNLGRTAQAGQAGSVAKERSNRFAFE